MKTPVSIGWIARQELALTECHPTFIFDAAKWTIGPPVTGGPNLNWIATMRQLFAGILFAGCVALNAHVATAQSLKELIEQGREVQKQDIMTLPSAKSPQAGAPAVSARDNNAAAAKALDNLDKAQTDQALRGLVVVPKN